MLNTNCKKRQLLISVYLSLQLSSSMALHVALQVSTVPHVYGYETFPQLNTYGYFINRAFYYICCS